MDLHVASEAKANDHAWLEEDKFMRMVENIPQSI